MRELGLKKTLLWLFLALASLPLHLLYNYTVFSTTQANSYNVFSVNDFFLSQSGPGSVNTTDAVSSQTNPGANNVYFDLDQPAVKKSSTLQNLSNADCITAYVQVFQTTRSNVLLVTNTSTNRLIQQEPVFNPSSQKKPASLQPLNPNGWLYRPVLVDLFRYK